MFRADEVRAQLREPRSDSHGTASILGATSTSGWQNDGARAWNDMELWPLAPIVVTSDGVCGAEIEPLRTGAGAAARRVCEESLVQWWRYSHEEPTMDRWLAPALLVLGLLVAGACVFVYAGVLDVGADKPHWNLTAQVLSAIRDRSIAVRASRQVVPDLADPDLIALGAEHYSEMCTDCHLSPGQLDTELRQGLNPQPPRLALPLGRTPAEIFWIIKHGFRMTGMPAWGPTHDDRAIWGLVAFVQRLPTLDANGYAKLTQPGEASTDEHQNADRDKDDPDHHHDAAGGPPPAGDTIDRITSVSPEQSQDIGADHDH